jgi:hypothetical protein
MLSPLRRARAELRRLPAGFEPRDLRPAKADGALTNRSNRYLHHRLADARHRLLNGHAGEQAISVSVTSTPALPCGKCRSRGARQPSPATSTVRVSKAGFEPAFPLVRSIRYLHHQRRLSRARGAANPIAIFFLRRCERCAAIANSLWVRSAIGVRLIASFPPAGPARLGTRLSARAPGSGSPVPACAGMFSDEPKLRTTKKPSGAAGSGGSV